jgi:hypothetical protein
MGGRTNPCVPTFPGLCNSPGWDTGWDTDRVGGVVVMPNRYGHTNVGNTMRSGIDLFGPEELHDASELGAVEALARALAFLEAARPAWHSTAPCKSDPHLFTGGKAGDRAKAFTICGGCDHRQVCLDYAIELEDWTTVIYGGTDGAARRRLARQRQTIDPDEKEITSAAS